MAHALECRCPLLDYRVVEFAARQPLSSKMNEVGEQKVLLRHLLRRYLPEELVAPGKQGFSTPWEEWCRGGFEQRLRRAWEKQKNGVLSPAAVDFLFDSDSGTAKTRMWNAFSALCFMGEFE